MEQLFDANKLASNLPIVVYGPACTQKIYNCMNEMRGLFSVLEYRIKGQPGAHSSHLRRVRGRVRPLWVLCTQHFPTFLKEDVFIT
jgi:hypothetical protein